MILFLISTGTLFGLNPYYNEASSSNTELLINLIASSLYPQIINNKENHECLK